jgi:8-oxo-dGTP pyrophosphatase MutT (NUDIX family)
MGVLHLRQPTLGHPRSGRIAHGASRSRTRTPRAVAVARGLDPRRRNLGHSRIEAAVREAFEEVGIDVRFLEVKDLYSDDHGNWRYDTVIAHVTGDVGAHEANYESDEVRWVALSDIESYDLHPGLRNSWPHVLPKLSATLP